MKATPRDCADAYCNTGLCAGLPFCRSDPPADLYERSTGRPTTCITTKSLPKKTLVRHIAKYPTTTKDIWQRSPRGIFLAFVVVDGLFVSPPSLLTLPKLQEENWSGEWCTFAGPSVPLFCAMHGRGKKAGFCLDTSPGESTPALCRGRLMRSRCKGAPRRDPLCPAYSAGHGTAADEPDCAL